MRNKQLKLIVFGVVAVGAVSLAIHLRQKQLTPKVTVHNHSHSAPLADSTTTADQSAPLASSSDGGTNASVSNPSPADPGFQKWLSREAKNLDLPSVDSSAKQEELRQVVRKMTPIQSRQLLLTAKNPRAPAGEKILSTYLLVESGSRGYGELSELIAAPLVDKGPHPPHSEEEMRGVRDKSLRIMGIDGLFAQAQKDPRARETLARTIPAIDDPFIRSYAEDKLRQLR